MPVALVLSPGPRAKATVDWFGQGKARDGDDDVLEFTGWTIDAIFPEPKDRADAPPSCPSPVERIFRQARSTHRRQEFDAAGMLYRKTVEAAVKELDPAGKGTLEKRIDALANGSKIPTDVAKWAHEVRFVGNDAAYDHDEPSREDIDATSEFVEAFLQYTFTMPQKMAARLSKAAA